MIESYKLKQTKQTIYRSKNRQNMKTFKQFIKESEDIMPKSKTIYTAVELDEDSHNKLKQEILKFIPKNWVVLCHHMTVNLGPASNGPAEHLLGKECSIIATHIAQNEKVIAVKVESNCPSNNSTPHITVAVDYKNGGKQRHSNSLTNWTVLENPINLKGILKIFTPED